MGTVPQIGPPRLIYSSCRDRGHSKSLEEFAKTIDFQVLLSNFNLPSLGWGWAYAIPIRHLPPPLLPG